MSNGNMYAANLRIAWELFAANLEGNRSGAVVVISEAPLPENARTALDSSMRALGYGAEICTFAVLRGKRAALDESGTAGEGEVDGRSTRGVGGAVGRDGGGAGGAAGRDGGGAGGDGASAPIAPTAPTLDGDALRMLVEGLDPLCIVIADRASSAVFSKAYQERCPLDAAGRVLGRSIVAFTSFASLLETPADKQRAWALLKTLPRFGGA